MSFPLNRKSVATSSDKDLFKIYFQEMEKMPPMERILEMLEQNGFHQQENQFPLARKKDLLKNEFTLDGKSFI